MSDFSKSDPFHVARLAEMGLQLAAVVHELRQPLAGVKLALRLAQHVAEGPEREQAIGDAMSEIERLSGVLDRACGFLQPTATSIETFDLIPVVERVARLMEHSLRAGKIQPLFSLEPIPPVRASSSAVAQILFNLVNNSLESLLAQGGQGRLMIHGQVQADRAVIIVADDGVGVPAGSEQAIFQPYVTSKGERGTGLGLFVSRELCRAFGGELTLLTHDEAAASVAGPPPAAAFSLRIPLDGAPSPIRGRDGEEADGA